MLFHWKDDTLREAFSKYGRIVDLRIARAGNVSLGFGFVTYDDPRDAEDALERYSPLLLPLSFPSSSNMNCHRADIPRREI